MPQFSYIAKSLNGYPCLGRVDVKDEKELQKNLDRQGLSLLKIQRQEISSAQRIPNFYAEKKESVENLKIMISNGVSFNDALNSLASRTRVKEIRSFLVGSAEQLTRGKSFSETLADQKPIFSQFEQDLLKTAEGSGNLTQGLTELANYMEKENSVKSKMRKNFGEPLSTFASVFILILGTMMFSFPKIFSNQTSLPFTAQAMVSASDFLFADWIYVLIGLTAIGMIFWLLAKSKKVQRILFSPSARNSFYPSFSGKLACACVLRDLSSLIAIKTPVAESLEIISRNTKNIVFKDALKDIKERMKHNVTFGQALNNRRDVFPVLISRMVESGQEKNELAETLRRLSDFYAEETEVSAQKIVSVVEIAFIIFLGLAAGFAVASVSQPFYSMLGGF